MNFDPKVCAMIDDLNLTQAKLRLIQKGWSRKKCTVIERKYKNFLKLISTGMPVSPTKLIDELWHLHILDTKTYAEDCQRIFGRFIHHYPYIGEGDSTVLPNLFAETSKAYQEAFGEPYLYA